MKKKKLIFIGGTSYSGSTFLNLILGNNKKAMSFGEINRLFDHYKPHHVAKIKDLRSTDIRWDITIADGKKKLYENISTFFPEADIMIDSSKDVNWIKQQYNYNKDKFDCKIILTYKSPSQIASSYIKRGKEEWERVYNRYHNFFFNTFKNFHALPNDFYETPELINDLEDYVGYNFKLKSPYKEHEFNFFGNNHANTSINRQKKDTLVDSTYSNQTGIVKNTNNIKVSISRDTENTYKKIEEQNYKASLKFVILPRIKSFFYEAKVYFKPPVSVHV
ncbi:MULTISPECIES: hypothetical protein [Flammeovirga]|uniref:Sulfotransferase family protein n=1 Tax=Flammeovirga agarivorans TaxID=2726742 RepID=A0A7X8SPD6_9BACT|nr:MULTISPECIES: hypothetical protein [Flammeovirga]NLR93936.1 hypothetical protein [Flammeovirga agarivorans]